MRWVFGVLGVAAIFAVLQMGGAQIATVEHPVCQDVPPGHHVHIQAPEVSLYLPSNSQPLKKGRVYKLSYAVGDGRITAAEDVRAASCTG